jgi:beta-lactamase regulating signal transducer with metallopeptidase domain
MRPSVPSTAREAQGISNDAFSTVQTLAMGGWLLIATILAAHTLGVSLRLWQMMRSVQPSTDPRLTKILRSAAGRLGITQQIQVDVTPFVEQPAVLGIVRPRVLLPPDVAAEFASNDLEMIFLHELAHVKRRDIAMNWVLAVLRAIHWFKPAFYVAARRMAAERELACDALVLAVVGHDRHRQYGYLLLRLIERMTDHQTKRRAVPVGMTGIVHFSERSRFMKERIAMLKVSSHRNGLGRGMLPYGLVAGLALLGLTNAPTNAGSAAAADTSTAATVADVGAPDAGAPLTKQGEGKEHTEQERDLAKLFPFGPNTRVSIGHASPTGKAYAQPASRRDDTASLAAKSETALEGQQVLVMYEVGDLVDRVVVQRNTSREKAREIIEWLIASVAEPQVPQPDFHERDAIVGNDGVAMADADDGPIMMRWFEESKLLIRQTQVVHERIADRLEFFRQYPICMVAIDAHFVATPMVWDDLLDGIELAERPREGKPRVPVFINCHVLSEDQAQRVLARLHDIPGTKVLSHPKLEFLNDQTANITVHSQHPFTFTEGTEGQVKSVTFDLPVLYSWIQLGIRGRVTGTRRGTFLWELAGRDAGRGNFMWGTGTELLHGQWVIMEPAPGMSLVERASLVVLAKIEIKDVPLP